MRGHSSPSKSLHEIWHVCCMEFERIFRLVLHVCFFTQLVQSCFFCFLCLCRVVVLIPCHIG